MKSNKTPRRSGFTLIELTLALGLGLMVGSVMLAVVNQQVAFLTIYRKQNFLIDEAPMMNMYFSRIVSKADKVELCTLSLNDEMGTPAEDTQTGNALKMYFRQPDGTWTASLLAYSGTHHKLSYYNLADVDATTVGNANWEVARLGADPNPTAGKKNPDPESESDDSGSSSAGNSGGLIGNIVGLLFGNGNNEENENGNYGNATGVTGNGNGMGNDGSGNGNGGSNHGGADDGSAEADGPDDGLNEAVNVRFTLNEGVVTMTLNGPEGERISYSSYPSYSGSVAQ